MGDLSLTSDMPSNPCPGIEHLAVYHDGDTETLTTRNAAAEIADISIGKVEPCFVCGGKSKNRCSRCGKVWYCTVLCQKSHWDYHKKTCSSKHGSTILNGRRGTVGLINTGNSCYLNSTLQCLTHSFPLTRLFLSDKYLSEINEGNRDGSGFGKLVREYGNVCKEIWFSDKTSISPLRLKMILGNINQVLHCIK